MLNNLPLLLQLQLFMDHGGNSNVVQNGVSRLSRVCARKNFEVPRVYYNPVLIRMPKCDHGWFSAFCKRRPHLRMYRTTVFPDRPADR